MKITKITAIALAALLTTACDDDSDYDNLNTAGGVTVEMGDAVMPILEVGSLYNVPIKVSGKTNGELIVYVKSEPTGSDPAEEEVNYSITSNRIIIPAGADQSRVEIQPIDDVEENANRTFKIVIERVEGASIGAQNSTIVEIEDDDHTPYAKLRGKWAMFGKTVFEDGDDLGNYVNIVAPDPSGADAAQYGRMLYAYGFMGYSFVWVPINYSYDENTGQIKLSLAVGQPLSDLSSPLNFGSFKGALFSTTIFDPDGAMNPGKRFEMKIDLVNENGEVLMFSQADSAQMYFVTIRVAEGSSAPYEYKKSAGNFEGYNKIQFLRPELLN